MKGGVKLDDVFLGQHIWHSRLVLAVGTITGIGGPYAGGFHILACTTLLDLGLRNDLRIWIFCGNHLD